MSFSGARPAWQLPVQWPQPAGAPLAADDLRVERLLKAAIVVALLAVTVLDRFGIRLTASYSVPPGMIALYGLVAAMMVAGVAEVNLRGTLAYVLVVSTAALSYLVNASFEPVAHVTAPSFLLLAVLYAPFAVSFRAGGLSQALRQWTMRLFIAFAVFLALAGIAQFFAQFAFRPEWLFDYTGLIPEPLRASGGWNMVNPVGEWTKSNGFFLREASMLSILMALALLCELSLDRRLWVAAILGSALVLTYSGSGLVCLAVALLFPLGKGSFLRLLAFALIAAAVLFLLGEALHLSYTLDRVQELDSDQSSAYCRFVYPGVMVLQQLDATLWSGLLGHGPGSMSRMGGTCPDLHQPTYGKLAFEYGLAGVLAFGTLMGDALTRAAVPVRIVAALAVTWLFLGGNLLAAEVLLLVYLLSAMWRSA